MLEIEYHFNVLDSSFLIGFTASHKTGRPIVGIS